MGADPRELAGALLWVGIPGTNLDDATEQHLSDLRPGGVILFKRNIRSLEQVTSLCTELRTLLGDDLFVAVDQEGGLVERFAGLLPSFPGNMALGAIATREPTLGEHLAREQGRLTGTMLRCIGVDVVLAPALDLATTGANPSTGIRSFGNNSELAARLGAALIDGLHAGGVLPCAKHFPGLGSANVDSHLDLPFVAAQDHAQHLAPFSAAVRAAVPLVMTSHVVYQALDAKNPATFSRAITTDLLRGKLEFTGLVLTDDMEMGAIGQRFDFAAAIRNALAAGHDVLTVCSDAALQREARAVLVEGIARSESWCAGARNSVLRATTVRDSLLPQASRSIADMTALTSEAHQLAAAIAGRAITVLSDPKRLVPLHAGNARLSTNSAPARAVYGAAGQSTTNSILLLLPVLEAGTLVEDPLRGEADGSALVQALGDNVSVLRIPARPDAVTIGSAIAKAAEHQTVLLALTAARSIGAQADLARALCAAHPRVVLLALRSPFDLEVVPESANCAMLASYGFRDAQLEALAKVLLGRTQPFGRLPVRLEGVNT